MLEAEGESLRRRKRSICTSFTILQSTHRVHVLPPHRRRSSRMTMTPAPRTLHRPGRALRTLLGAALAIALAAGSAAAAGAETVTVNLDQATVVRMPERVATIIIGNPLIADVSLQAGGIMVVTGKSFGVTNVLALDRNGGVVMDKAIQVRGPRDDVLVVHRGLAQESY